MPAEEWAEIFDEVWRRYRDFFYVENMHGYDWEALREQYKPLLALRRPPLRPELRDRRDDRRAERSSTPTSRAATGSRRRGRAWPCPAPASSSTRPPAATASPRSSQGQNEEDLYRSPLTEVGVDAQVGDYVLAIDGEELTANDDPYRLLRNKADQPVRADAQHEAARWTARAR